MVVPPNPEVLPGNRQPSIGAYAALGETWGRRRADGVNAEADAGESMPPPPNRAAERLMAGPADSGVKDSEFRERNLGLADRRLGATGDAVARYSAVCDSEREDWCSPMRLDGRDRECRWGLGGGASPEGCCERDMEARCVPRRGASGATDRVRRCEMGEGVLGGLSNTAVNSPGAGTGVSTALSSPRIISSSRLKLFSIEMISSRISRISLPIPIGGSAPFRLVWPDRLFLWPPKAPPPIPLRLIPIPPAPRPGRGYGRVSRYSSSSSSSWITPTASPLYRLDAEEMFDAEDGLRESVEPDQPETDDAVDAVLAFREWV